MPTQAILSGAAVAILVLGIEPSGSADVTGGIAAITLRDEALAIVVPAGLVLGLPAIAPLLALRERRRRPQFRSPKPYGDA
ncbi:MAG: hypothetical protein ACXVJW_19095 [Acidimicrobiia bacterium]